MQVLSLGAGSLAFVNVVKSLEPLFNAVFGAIFMKDMLPWQARRRCSRSPQAAAGGGTNPADRLLPWQVNACLLPVIAGVGIASATDLSFTWECFAYAMGSNLAFSLRGAPLRPRLLGLAPSVERL